MGVMGRQHNPRALPEQAVRTRILHHVTNILEELQKPITIQSALQGAMVSKARPATHKMNRLLCAQDWAFLWHFKVDKSG